MRKYILSFVSLCLVISFISCSKDDENSEFVPVKVGDTLPTFKVTMSDGSVYDSSVKSTQPTLIVFFHTTCPDCQQELPILQQLYDNKDLNFKLVLITRAESAYEVEAYFKLHDLSMPYSAQEDRAIYNLFAESIIPRGYLCNKQNQVVFLFTDTGMPTYEDLKTRIEQLNE